LIWLQHALLYMLYIGDGRESAAGCFVVGT
jgi:hypothetical protein